MTGLTPDAGERLAPSRIVDTWIDGKGRIRVTREIVKEKVVEIPIADDRPERLAPLSEQEIEKLERLEKAATEGPWRYDSVFHGDSVEQEIRGLDGWFWLAPRFGAGPTDDYSDRELVVALRNAAPSLLHSARVLQEIRRMGDEERWADRLWPVLKEAERRAASEEEA